MRVAVFLSLSLLFLETASRGEEFCVCAAMSDRSLTSVDSTETDDDVQNLALEVESTETPSPKVDLRQQRLASYKNIRGLLSPYQTRSSDGTTSSAAVGAAAVRQNRSADGAFGKSGMLDLTQIPTKVSSSSDVADLVGATPRRHDGQGAGRRRLQRTSRHGGSGGDPGITVLLEREAYPFGLDYAYTAIQAALGEASLKKVRASLAAEREERAKEEQRLGLDPVELHKKRVWVMAQSALKCSEWRKLAKLVRESMADDGVSAPQQLEGQNLPIEERPLVYNLPMMCISIDQRLKVLLSSVSHRSARVVSEDFEPPEKEIPDPAVEVQDDEDGEGDGASKEEESTKVLVRSQSTPSVKLQLLKTKREEVDPPTIYWRVLPHVGAQVSVSSDEGRRSHQEDSFAVLDDSHMASLSEGGLKDSHPASAGMVCVFDGHSGSSCSAYVRVALPFNICQYGDVSSGKMSEADEQETLERSYIDCNTQFNSRPQTVGQANVSGSTAASLVVRKDELLFANCGDTEALVCYGRQKDDPGRMRFDLLSTKHSAESEKAKIEELGGKVVWFGSWRVNGILAVSRSLGDPNMGDVVRPDPSVSRFSRTDAEKRPLFAILATDGLWDVLSYERAAKIVMEHVFPDDGLRSKMSEKEANKAERRVRSTSARRLVSAALMLGSADNTTAAVVFFDEE